MDGRECEEMKADILQGPAGAPKGTLGDAKCVTNSLGEGKNKEVGVGTNFKIGKLILSKKIKFLQPDVIF